MQATTPSETTLTEPVTIASFLDEPQASLAQHRLLAEGIEASLWDQNLVGINWLYSQAVGGVKLTVDASQADEARKILGEDYGDLIPEAVREEEPTCPRCGGKGAASYDPLRVLAALTLLPAWPLAILLGIPFIRWHIDYRCLDCGGTWAADRKSALDEAAES